MTSTLLTISLFEWANKCNEVDAKQAEINALKESIKEHDKWEKEEAIAFAVIKEEWRTQIIEKKAEIDEALDRLWDMSLADDGQAWKEAERFYSKHRDNWGKHKGE